MVRNSAVLAGNDHGADGPGRASKGTVSGTIPLTSPVSNSYISASDWRRPLACAFKIASAISSNTQPTSHPKCRQAGSDQGQ